MLWDFNTAFKFSILIFPVIALIFTLPYMVYQYAKHGSVIFWRTLVIYSFCYYLLLVYFLVILPLPSRTAVAQMSGPTMQLELFRFLSDFFNNTGFQLLTISTWKEALLSTTGQQIILNIIMLVPFGVYMHYYFEESLWTTLFLTFLISLFLECTQLSGLYGIYTRPYRLFDVDDLLLNTIGGLFGYLLAPLIKRLLPSRAMMDEQASQQKEAVSLMRRGAAMLVDGGCIILLSAVAYKVIFKTLNRALLFAHPKQYLKDLLVNENAYLLVLIFGVLLMVVIPWITKGFTIGKRLVGIRLLRLDQQPLRIWNIFVRTGLIYGALMFLYYSGLTLFYLERVTELALNRTLVHLFVFIFVAMALMVDFLLSAIRHRPCIYELLSRTINENIK